MWRFLCVTVAMFWCGTTLNAKLTNFLFILVDDYDAEESYGLIGVGLCQDKRIEFPIRDIDVERNDPNHQLLDDYRFWMANY